MSLGSTWLRASLAESGLQFVETHNTVHTAVSVLPYFCRVRHHWCASLFVAHWVACLSASCCSLGCLPFCCLFPSHRSSFRSVLTMPALLTLTLCLIVRLNCWIVPRKHHRSHHAVLGAVMDEEEDLSFFGMTEDGPEVRMILCQAADPDESQNNHSVNHSTPPLYQLHGH